MRAASEKCSLWQRQSGTLGKDRDHDCIIGVSGGVDSSYVAYLAKEKLGLRPLILHVDAGWNSQQSVNNIEKMVDGLGLDLHTEVIDWEEMKDLQLVVLQGSGAPSRYAAGPCILRRTLQLRGRAWFQVHHYRRKLFHGVRA